MAEAAVEERPTTRFFCHRCDLEFENASADCICPRCSEGFVEKLDALPSVAEDDWDDWNPAVQGNAADIINQLMTLFGVSLPELPPLTPREGGGRNVRPRAGDASRRRRGGARGGRSQFDDLLTEAVLQFTEQTLGGSQRNNSMFIVGNPANYAWSREGFDSIVTQLWNQMDGTGPPPMPRERIGEIPTVNVTEEQVKSTLQCSICWEPFVVGEPVRSLPCYHVYHGACICPWLELHATCPICRRSLRDDGEMDDDSVARANLDTLVRGATNNERNDGRISFSSMVRRSRAQLNSQARAQARTQARANQADQTNPAPFTEIAVPMPSSSGSSTPWRTIQDSSSNGDPQMPYTLDDFRVDSDMDSEYN